MRALKMLASLKFADTIIIFSLSISIHYIHFSFGPSEKENERNIICKYLPEYNFDFGHILHFYLLQHVYNKKRRRWVFGWKFSAR